MRKAALRCGLFCALLICAPAFADKHPGRLGPDAIRAMVASQTDAAIDLFAEFLALPNDANKPDDIAAQNHWILKTFAERGFSAKLLSTAGSDAVFAERPSEQSERTLLVYLQADGQPVDPTAWEQADPYVATLKAQDEEGNWRALDWETLKQNLDPDWRIFARSAADSKGPMIQFLMAVDLLTSAKPDLGYNLKVLIDTEEELGSPHLEAAIKAHREMLAADMLLIFDGPPHASNRPTVSLGARGIATITLTTYGPRVAQHSGHYGNFVPNPALALAQILASMKSPDGVVTIDGFYDGVVIDEDTRVLLDAVPDDEEAILNAMGLVRSDKVGASLQEAIQYPSLNIRGLSAAWTGTGSRTIIPPTAVAEIDMRLVLESDPESLVQLLRRHIEDLGYSVLDHAPTNAERLAHERIVSMTYDISYGAFRTDPDAAPARMARAGMHHLYGEEPILLLTMGGSIPIAPIIDALGIPAATVPTVNMDNNQHSPNENLRVGNFLEGIAILMAVLQEAPP